MRKRERENPCGVCGHYHKYEEGEVCSICGHRIAVGSEKTSIQVSAFPSVILPEFLYLGSYDNASRSELLKTQGISRILNTVPACQNLYKNSFTYHCLPDDKSFPFDEANQFLEQCEKDKERVLVHCMSGKSRSPAIVIGYLMKSRGWRLAQSFMWVKERRTSVELSEGAFQQLQEYEKNLFASAGGPLLSPFSHAAGPSSISFGFPKTNDLAPLPAFSCASTPSIFARAPLDVAPTEFTFGASQSVTGNPFNTTNPPNPNVTDIQMDGS
ncbi:protein-tyrosine-phosphatase IBR5 [Cicer arietinum]|uniref:Protein-tyrosine-phosphatase IBR5 n=1 Tax=Cicer arietinum TaxID=3827 RepID=A0A1S2XLB0_CICAR|nr:protein-tyrosine-phosphatase IBR5 [Cicer arietinum]